MPHLAPFAPTADLVFLSGQLALDADGRLAGASVREQTTICLANLERVLEGIKLDRRAIVKTTAWITQASAFPAFDAAYAAFFGAHRPARSTVVAGLVLPGALIEIEAVALRSAV